MNEPDPLEAIRHDLLAAAVSPDFAQLVDTMSAQGKPVASQLEALRIVAAVRDSVRTGYGMSITLGMSPEEANAHRATALLLAIAEYLGVDATHYDKIFKL